MKAKPTFQARRKLTRQGRYSLVVIIPAELKKFRGLPWNFQDNIDISWDEKSPNRIIIDRVPA